MSRGTNHTRTGESVFNSLEKANSELVALMYGSLVTQLLKDLEDVDLVNAELDRLGYDAGVRMVEEFLAKTQISGCADFAETCEVIAKVGFKVFLGVTGEVSKTENDATICYVAISDNPLNDFVELPDSLSQLNYSAFICGVIRGALEQLQIRVKVSVVQDQLKGGETNEFRIELIELLNEKYVEPDD